jgi:RimJ/RimL family protein N-acetyltransferase
MSLRLRDVSPDDEGFLLEVYASTRAQELALVPWSDEQRQAFVKMQFAAQRDHYQERYRGADYKVIVQDGEPVGRFYIFRDEANISILDITILPRFRERGIGTTLIKEIIDEAAQSANTVQIYVENFNPSLRLFQRLGFSIIAQDGINLLLEWRPPGDPKTS